MADSVAGALPASYAGDSGRGLLGALGLVAPRGPLSSSELFVSTARFTSELGALVNRASRSRCFLGLPPSSAPTRDDLLDISSLDASLGLALIVTSKVGVSVPLLLAAHLGASSDSRGRSYWAPLSVKDLVPGASLLTGTSDHLELLRSPAPVLQALRGLCLDGDILESHLLALGSRLGVDQAPTPALLNAVSFLVSNVSAPLEADGSPALAAGLAYFGPTDSSPYAGTPGAPQVVGGTVRVAPPRGPPHRPPRDHHPRDPRELAHAGEQGCRSCARARGSAASAQRAPLRGRPLGLGAPRPARGFQLLHPGALHLGDRGGGGHLVSSAPHSRLALGTPCL